MASHAGRSLFVGASASVGIACIAIWFGRPAAFPMLLLAGTAGGMATAAARTAGGPLRPVGEAARTAPEVASAGRQGYDIGFRMQPPAKRFERYAFVARQRGSVAGRLDADFVNAEKLLYVQNIFVPQEHRKRGLATALLVSAVLTTNCSVVATSGRTADGTPFFLGMRSILKRNNVELRNGPA